MEQQDNHKKSVRPVAVGRPAESAAVYRGQEPGSDGPEGEFPRHEMPTPGSISF